MRYGWNMDPQCWKNLSTLVSGLSWTRVPFEKINAAIVPSSPGVYLICAGTPAVTTAPFTDFFNVLYAGLSTTSVRSRFIKHCTCPDDGVRSGKRCYGFITSQMYFYYTTADSNSVAEIERHMIECFGPPCNRQSGIAPIIRAKLGSERPAG